MGDLPPTQVETNGDRTLLIRLAWEDDFGWDVAERLRPGTVHLRPVWQQAIEPPELSSRLRPEEVMDMAPEARFGASSATCDLLLGMLSVPELAETADPSKPVASCRRDQKLASTKYLLGPATAGPADIAAVRCAKRPDTQSQLVFSLTKQVRAETGMIAVVLDGVVLATVGPAARDDELTIEGHFTSPHLAVLCAQPRYAPLPVALRPEFAR